MASQPVQAVLYRILGNDLPPRYSPGQTLANLRFTLENEQELPGLEKRWLLNRIVCPDTLAALQGTIRAAGQRFDVIPFEEEAYRQVWTDLGKTPPECHPWSTDYQQLPRLMQLRISDYIARFKNQYLMNNNGARNRAIALGLADAEWVLPWDGGCFLPAWAWEKIQAVMVSAQVHYLCVPMHRLADNASMPRPEDRDAVDWDEPQVGFSQQAQLHFDESLRYGSMPKALLLRRMGLPGPWQHSEEGWLPWEYPELTPAADAGAFQLCGLVMRLGGEQQGEHHVDVHGLWGLRFVGILKFIRAVDLKLMHRQLESSNCFLGPLQFEDHCPFTKEMVPAPSPRSWAELPAVSLYRLALRYQQHGDLIALEQARVLVKGWCLDPVTALDVAELTLMEVCQLEGLVLLCYALALLQQIRAFSPEEIDGLQVWWTRLLTWLLAISHAFLAANKASPISIGYHLVLLIVAIQLREASVCCQIMDNIPGLLALAPSKDSATWQALLALCAALERHPPIPEQSCWLL